MESIFWIAGQPLVLASRSVGRLHLLHNVYIPVEVIPADLDERDVEAEAAARGIAHSPRAVSVLLAHAKALTVSRLHPGRLVLGCDQTLDFGSRSFAKPESRAAARAQLETLAGHWHSLHASAVLARDGEVLAEMTDSARLHMRALSQDFLDLYFEAAGDAVVSSVGAYQIEALGPHLFQQISGDHATIVGLPLLKVLDALRAEGSLRA